MLHLSSLIQGMLLVVATASLGVDGREIQDNGRALLQRNRPPRAPRRPPSVAPAPPPPVIDITAESGADADGVAEGIGLNSFATADFYSDTTAGMDGSTAYADAFLAAEGDDSAYVEGDVDSEAEFTFSSTPVV